MSSLPAPLPSPSLWRNPAFRLAFSASAFSHLGTGVYAVAFPWFATLLTRNPVLIGMVAMAPQLPWLLFALPVGVWTDRLDHRRTIVWGNLAMAGLALAVVALALWARPGLAAVWALAGLAFLIGSVEVLRDNTAQTILPDVVPDEALEGANAAIQSSENLAGQFAGPPLAGAMIASGIALPFGFHALMLAISSGLFALVQAPSRRVASAQAFWPALREGVAWLWANRALRDLGFALGAYNFLYQVIWGVMVLYAQDALHLDALRYGALLSALAIGGLAGGIAAPAILARVGIRRGLLLSVAGFALSSAVLAVTRNPWLAGAALLADAFTSMTWNVATVSYRQRHIPAAYLGRVNSVYRFIGSGPRPFGSFLGGAIVGLAAPLGETALHLPFAAATLGGAALWLWSRRRLAL